MGSSHPEDGGGLQVHVPLRNKEGSGFSCTLRQLGPRGFTRKQRRARMTMNRSTRVLSSSASLGSYTLGKVGGLRRFPEEPMQDSDPPKMYKHGYLRFSAPLYVGFRS